MVNEWLPRRFAGRRTRVKHTETTSGPLMATVGAAPAASDHGFET
jgi:hypothetical protein